MTNLTSLPPEPYASARFYPNEGSLARIVADFLTDGFRAGSPGIVVATVPHCSDVVRELSHRTIDVEALQRSRDLLMLDADQVLSTFMVDGEPNGEKFNKSLTEIVELGRGGQRSGPIRLFGQLIDVLWQRGQREAAIRLELLWNQLGCEQPLLCAYAVGHFYKGLGLHG
ncbi:MAG: MEDS domain-containing protein [Vicinamibacterales bacterium]